MRLRSVLLNGLVFLVSLLGFCQALRAGLETQPKLLAESHWRSQLLLEHFLKQKDELDLVFVGSSRFLRGVNPAAFDEMTQTAGHGTRSFNYAMNGMRMHEIIACVDWIIAKQPKRLRHVLVELTTLDPLYRDENRRARRIIEWHTTRASLDSLRVILGSNRAPAAKFEDALPHLVEYALHLCNLGLGQGALEQLFEAPRAEAQLENFNGYVTDAEVEARLSKLQSSTPAEKKTKRTKKKALVQEAGDMRDELPATQEKVLREFIARVQAAGIELAFVTMPAPCYENTPGFYFDRTGNFARAKGVLPSSFHYYDRDKYASLYRPVNFIDAGHLSPPGAIAFSRRLALDFLGEYGTQRGSD